MAENDAIVETLTTLVDELVATVFNLQFANEDARATTRLYTRCVSAIRRFAPPNSVYRHDFLAMASELDTKGFHAPAAVLAGSVLDEHLRKLADKSKIDVPTANGRPKSVDALGIELVKAGAITEARRKILAGWYGQ